MDHFLHTLCWLSYLCHLSTCISLDQLFPFGLQSGDSPLLPGKYLSIFSHLTSDL